MLFKIAWRNIWRSRTRSLVVIGAVVVGVWAIIFLISFSSGMVTSYINNAIENEISHIQVHHPQFKEDEEVQFILTKADDMMAEVRQVEGVEAAAVRILINGMLSTSKGGVRGIRIKAVEPAEEAAVTHLDEKIVEGEYFGTGKSKKILIGRRLAEKMKVKIRSKLVLTFQDLDGDLTAIGFRVGGIFDTSNNAFDENTVFLKRQDLNAHLGDENLAHEAAMVLTSPGEIETVQTVLKNRYPDLLVENYKEISPEIELFQSQIKLSAIIFTVIVMLGLVFGIINTMLMAVLERIKELGMLMAIGMNKGRVFSMIVFETVMLGLIASPIGLALGYFTVHWLNRVGIDLSAWSAGMKEFGLSTVVYPNLDSQFYGLFALAVVITAILGSLYPAYKAIRLRPVEALRKL